jgi:hypothetical protein
MLINGAVARMLVKNVEEFQEFQELECSEFSEACHEVWFK